MPSERPAAPAPACAVCGRRPARECGPRLVDAADAIGRVADTIRDCASVLAMASRADGDDGDEARAVARIVGECLYAHAGDIARVRAFLDDLLGAPAASGSSGPAPASDNA